MRRGLVLLVGVGAAAAACAGPEGRAGPREAPRPSSVPPVARVICDESGTRILTPEVRLGADGVDFSIQNVTGTTFVFYPGNPEEVRPGMVSEFVGPGDNSVSPGTKEMRWLVPPGPTRIVCLPSGRRLPPDESRSREGLLQLLDPANIFVPVPLELDCKGGPDRSYGFIVPVRTDDPDEPVRATRERLVGLRPGDDVSRTGYPGDRYPWVQIVRESRIVGLVNIGPVIGSDSSVLWTCVSSGIRPADPPPAPKRPRIPSPIPTDTFPPQSRLVEGRSYWVLYLAIAEKGSPELDDAIGRAHLYGYEPYVRSLGCDERVDDRYPRPKDFLAVGIYFDRERDPWFVGDAINAPHWEPTRITAHCVD
jgi:hypothetical protein